MRRTTILGSLMTMALLSIAFARTSTRPTCRALDVEEARSIRGGFSCYLDCSEPCPPPGPDCGTNACDHPGSCPVETGDIVNLTEYQWNLPLLTPTARKGLMNLDEVYCNFRVYCEPQCIWGPDYWTCTQAVFNPEDPNGGEPYINSGIDAKIPKVPDPDSEPCVPEG